MDYQYCWCIGLYGSINLYTSSLFWLNNINWTSVMKNTFTLIEKLKNKHILESLITDLNNIEKALTKHSNEIKHLSKQPLIYGSLHFRKDSTGSPKYCYIIHTTKGHKARERDYLGVDEEKIKLAAEAIARTNKLEQLKNKSLLINQDFLQIYDRIMTLKQSIESFKI